jgi:hypothetical protein
MLILLSLVAYLILGLPFVAWLGHRLARAHREHAAAPEAARGTSLTPGAVAG